MINKKNKILSSVLALVLSLGLAGCGAKNNTTKDTAPKNETSQSESKSDSKSNEVSDSISSSVNSYFSNMPEDIYKIPQKTFVEKVTANEDIFVLDIRQPDVYAKGHIKGAVNAPWGTAISDNLDKLPKDKTIMVYCYTGQTAGQTVSLLNMAGFNARSVNLGWDLGISKVEGVNDITETEANEFKEVESLEIDPEIKTAIEKYYAGLADVKGTMYKNYKISENNAKKLLDEKDESVIFLSIRDKADFDKGHIESAINIPWGKGMEKSFDTLPKDKKIIVYCYTGQTAGQTVAGLRMLGYDAVSLNGGMGMNANAPSGWENKGFDLVK